MIVYAFVDGAVDNENDGAFGYVIMSEHGKCIQGYDEISFYKTKEEVTYASIIEACRIISNNFGSKDVDLQLLIPSKSVYAQLNGDTIKDGAQLVMYYTAKDLLSKFNSWNTYIMPVDLSLETQELAQNI
jgi:hypothetical protein